MAIMEPILAEIEQESATTRRLLERVPEDKLSWRPHPKCYSLGQLALHIASIPGALSAAVSVDSLELPKFRQPEAKSKAEILETFSKSLAQARENLAKKSMMPRRWPRGASRETAQRSGRCRAFSSCGPFCSTTATTTGVSYRSTCANSTCPCPRSTARAPTRIPSSEDESRVLGPRKR